MTKMFYGSIPKNASILNSKKPNRSGGSKSKSDKTRNTNTVTQSKKQSIYSTIIKSFLENIYSLNNSKFFAGMVMLTMNIGSKYVTIELSKTQESYLKYTLGRQLLIFAVLWMGTRDIVIALILTCVFILFADYLFNENSKFCIFPEHIKDLELNLDADGDGKISEKEIQDAIHVLKRARNKKKKTKTTNMSIDGFQSNDTENQSDDILKKELVKENFI
jgi:hypothetical protein